MPRIYVVPTDTCLGLGCEIDDPESYALLYEMKRRDPKKPISLLVQDWEELEMETYLNDRQIGFLQSYKFPFTVVCDVTDDFRVEYELDPEVYDRVGFRVGSSCLSSETLSDFPGSMFLTSANISDQPECKDIDELRATFPDYVKYFDILPGEVHNEDASNVFDFNGDTTELQYIRKNY